MSVHKFEDVEDLISICGATYDMSFVIIEPVERQCMIYHLKSESIRRVSTKKVLLY